jgi:hypothetical protein
MFLPLLHRAQEISIFPETLRNHTEYGDTLVYIFFLFFDILKFIFQIKGAYAHEMKSAFPTQKGLQRDQVRGPEPNQKSVWCFVSLPD